MKLTNEEPKKGEIYLRVSMTGEFQLDLIGCEDYFQAEKLRDLIYKGVGAYQKLKSKKIKDQCDGCRCPCHPIVKNNKHWTVGTEET